MKKIIKKILKICFAFIALIIAVSVAINVYVIKYSENYILTEEMAGEKEYDCILVLGAGVKGENPSLMLKDRLDKGIELFDKGSDKILMSGDHGSAEYDEVNVMKRYAVERGIPSENVFMDHAGFSTYDSMYRARDVFKAENVIIVTQKYHMYRAVFLARKLGIDAVGVCAEDIKYKAQFYRDARESVARIKDFISAIVKPKPKYLGEAIPVSGNGDLTDG